MSDEQEYFLAAEMRGRRPEMEDAHVIFYGLDNPNEPAREACMFGVFDGHGGDECARFCAQNLCKEIYSHALFSDDAARAMEEAFVATDNQYVHLAKQLALEDGSTAAVLLLQTDPDTHKLHYYLANVGDSRAVLVKRNGKAVCLVEDQTPDRADERARIQRDGGTIEYDEDANIYRVSSSNGGGLAVTRAFGDYPFKPFVCATPEIAQGEIGQDDAYVILASDGLWGDISNEEAGRVLAERGGQAAVEYLMEEAFARGSDDNITVILVDLQRALPRLVEESKTRPLSRRITPSLRHSRGNSTRFSRFSFSNSTATAAAMAAGGGNGSVSPLLIGGGGGEEGTDPLLVSVARKMSSAVLPSQLLLTTDVDDVQIPGLPMSFSNDLILWRDPVKTFLWFVTINAMFALAIKWNVSLVSIIAVSALLRLGMAFIACRLLAVLHHFGWAKQVDAAQFVDANFLVSERSMRYFANSFSGVICTVAARWDDLIMKGSTTNLLIFLRTLTYLYTPTPIADLSWMLFFFVFTVPATYARHKEALEAKSKELGERVSALAMPHVERAKAKLAEMEASVKSKLAVVEQFTGVRRGRAEQEEERSATPVLSRKPSTHQPSLVQALGAGYELSEEL